MFLRKIKNSLSQNKFIKHTETESLLKNNIQDNNTQNNEIDDIISDLLKYKIIDQAIRKDMESINHHIYGPSRNILDVSLIGAVFKIWIGILLIALKEALVQNLIHNQDSHEIGTGLMLLSTAAEVFGTALLLHCIDFSYRNFRSEQLEESIVKLKGEHTFFNRNPVGNEIISHITKSYSGEEEEVKNIKNDFPSLSLF